MWVGLYKVGQLDEVIDARAMSIGKKMPPRSTDDKKNDGDKRSRTSKRKHDHSDDAVVEIVWNKTLGPWDTKGLYEFRLFDAGWKRSKNESKLLFVPSRGPLAVSPAFAIDGDVDPLSVKPEPRPLPTPSDDKLASNRKVPKRRSYGDRPSNFRESGLPGTENIGREVRAGLYRKRTRVQVKFLNKWYDGTFQKANFSRRKKQYYAIQCDSDKPGVLTWSSMASMKILKNAVKDADGRVKKRSLSDSENDGNEGDTTETAGGSAWHIEI